MKSNKHRDSTTHSIFMTDGNNTQGTIPLDDFNNTPDILDYNEKNFNNYRGV